jgi:hypothetical protein
MPSGSIIDLNQNPSELIWIKKTAGTTQGLLFRLKRPMLVDLYQNRSKCCPDWRVNHGRGAAPAPTLGYI